MKYLVKIEETLAKHVIVEAESLDEAVTIAEDAYINGNIKLDYDDFCDTDVVYVRKAKYGDKKYFEEVSNG